MYISKYFHIPKILFRSLTSVKHNAYMYHINVIYFWKITLMCTMLLRDPPLCFFGGVVWKTLFSRSAFQSRVSAIHVTSQSFDEWFVAAEDLSIFFLQQCCYYLEKHVGVDSLCSTWLLNMGSQSALVEYACTYIDSDRKKVYWHHQIFLRTIG